VDRNRRRDRSRHVLIIVENVRASMDHRVSKQIESLVANGFRVSVITRRDPKNRRLRTDLGVRTLEYRSPPGSASRSGYVFEYGYSLIMATARAKPQGGRVVVPARFPDLPPWVSSTLTFSTIRR
jgi:hypothetical protein